MPQFDFLSFFVQIIWFSIFSCMFYLIYLKMPINQLSQVLKMRSKLKTLVSTSVKGTKNSFIYNATVSFFR